jgi:hypothetical protein
VTDDADRRRELLPDEVAQRDAGVVCTNDLEGTPPAFIRPNTHDQAVHDEDVEQGIPRAVNGTEAVE